MDTWIPPNMDTAHKNIMLHNRRKRSMQFQLLTLWTITGTSHNTTSVNRHTYYTHTSSSDPLCIIILKATKCRQQHSIWLHGDYTQILQIANRIMLWLTFDKQSKYGLCLCSVFNCTKLQRKNENQEIKPLSLAILKRMWKFCNHHFCLFFIGFSLYQQLWTFNMYHHSTTHYAF